MIAKSNYLTVVGFRQLALGSCTTPDEETIGAGVIGAGILLASSKESEMIAPA
ncbi:MAG: hypothetical protein ACK52I_06485 [Pseudomonadota bacterium]